MSWYVTDNHTLHLHLVGNTRLSAPTQHNEEEHPMTSLQIELPPELYARLQDEAQRQGKAEKLLAEELLADQLRSTTALEVPLYVHMMPHIRALVTTMNIDDFTVPGDGSLMKRLRFCACGVRQRQRTMTRVRSLGRMCCVLLMPVAPQTANSFQVWSNPNEPLRLAGFWPPGPGDRATQARRGKCLPSVDGTLTHCGSNHEGV